MPHLVGTVKARSLDQELEVCAPQRMYARSLASFGPPPGGIYRRHRATAATIVLEARDAFISQHRDQTPCATW